MWMRGYRDTIIRLVVGNRQISKVKALEE